MRRIYAALEKRMKTEAGLMQIETELIVELAESWEDIEWYNVARIALTGYPSTKNVAKIASQKSIDKQSAHSTNEMDSTKEVEENEDPKAETRVQKD